MPKKNYTMILKENTIARLFPVGNDANNERGITSIFLACISVTEAFAAGVLKSIGRNYSVRNSIECHTEISFPSDEKKRNFDRPDGLIILKQGKNVIWTA